MAKLHFSGVWFVHLVQAANLFVIRFVGGELQPAGLSAGPRESGCIVFLALEKGIDMGAQHWLQFSGLRATHLLASESASGCNRLETTGFSGKPSQARPKLVEIFFIGPTELNDWP